MKALSLKVEPSMLAERQNTRLYQFAFSIRDWILFWFSLGPIARAAEVKRVFNNYAVSGNWNRTLGLILLSRGSSILGVGQNRGLPEAVKERAGFHTSFGLSKSNSVNARKGAW